MSKEQPPSGKSSPPGRRWRDWVINLALILLVFYGVQWWRTGPLVAGEAPSLVGVTLDGHRVDLAELRGKPVLVHFWATWCPVCSTMEGSIDGLAKDHRLVTVALQSGGEEAIRTAMRGSGVSFPTISDPKGQIAARWGVRVVPSTFVIDPQGQISYSTVGVSTGPGLRLRLWAAASDG